LALNETSACGLDVGVIRKSFSLGHGMGLIYPEAVNASVQPKSQNGFELPVYGRVFPIQIRL
jgi:hypothetical protein